MTQSTEAPTTLRRTLRFRDLVLYGIILIQPVAPMPSFGVIYHQASGHVVTAILLAMAAMLFTSISYGHMSRVHPHGGSAFLYVGRELHPGLGYITGWCLVMDYVLNPLICTIWCARAAMNFVPGVPYAGWVLFFAGLFTLLNCLGVETSARINAAMAAVMGVVIVLVLTAAARFVLHTGPHPGAFYRLPFYDPHSFQASGLFHATSIAVLTYIGFDGISTLSDEARDPERNIPRAIVLTCLLTGVLAAVEVYAAQLVWPRGAGFADYDTAYVHVARRMGGPVLFAIVNATLLLANMGSGIAAQLGAARLLYAMGQDGALPASVFFTALSLRRVPRNSVLLIGGLTLSGALLMSYELGAELVNFGALLAFMGVNASSLVRYWRQERWARLLPMVTAAAGLVTCLFLFVHLGSHARITGCAWAVTGILLWIVRRRSIVLPA